ncbi:DUF2244 domain-containing protein [Pseudoroseomonas wenyumeiae]|nr:DUF2244 domain-containing protein [Pseudoroseomonas wenyumeiae]
MVTWQEGHAARERCGGAGGTLCCPGMPANPAPPRPEPVLFEAVSTPAHSFHRGLFLLLAGITLAWTILGGTVFLLVGAWPVFGFLGAESLLALGLVLLHHRRAGRAREVVRLADGRITVRRVDGRGQRTEASMDAYWAQVELTEREGLALVRRGHRIPVGVFLSEAEKEDLAGALRQALAAYRRPSFDNPQLR